ncbi:MAG TPA: glycosyltransferase family 87 protein [Pirellulaceae bacterium]|nr:glycosyltransferase family 87 protein [Pirellulaceae bacterium]HMP69497.1 glycosyltransferase family 87 protein [Pirellulaceae bacterium]
MGAHIVCSEQRDQLYDLEHFKKVQHDPALVGFRWTDTRYYPPIYAPGYYLLLSPSLALDYQSAAYVWLTFSCCCFVAATAVLYLFYPPCRRIFPWGLLLALVFCPLLDSLVIGHKSALLFLMLTVSFVLLYRGKPFLGGLCFGLIAFKPHLAIPICFVMLVKGNWRFAGGMLLTVLGWVSLSLVVSYDLTLQYCQALLGNVIYVDHAGYQLESAHTVWSLGQRLFGQNISATLFALTTSLLFVAWLIRIMSTCNNSERRLFAYQFSAMIIVTILVSPHFYFYDLTITLLPVLLLASAALEGEKEKNLLIAVVGFALLAGTFTVISHITHIQISFVWLCVLLFLIDSRLSMIKVITLQTTPARFSGSHTLACNAD